MNIGKACAIFEQIEADKYTEQDKLQAIKQVLEMPTHNGITKDEILTAFRWLFNQVTVEDSEKQTNADRIRAMSDEELAKLITSGELCAICPFCKYYGTDMCYIENEGVHKNCDKGIIDWLQSKAEENAVSYQSKESGSCEKI